LRRNKYLFIIVVLLWCCSCSKKKDLNILNDKPVIILVQPFKDMNSETTKFIAFEIKKFLMLLIYQKKAIIKKEIDIEQIPLFNI